MTLDTKVQPNLMTDWRNIYGYDKSEDAIVVNVGEGSYKDAIAKILNPVVGDAYTISFDAWGSTEDNKITTHCVPLRKKDVIAYAADGVNMGDDNGRVEWYNLSEKSKRYFTTYKLVEGARNYIIIRARSGTTYIRNIKLEKSPYPTDYEE